MIETSRQLDVSPIISQPLPGTGVDETLMNLAADMDDPATCPVNRRDGVALWRQICGRLQTEIASGTHKPGGRLPTEADLSAQFGVNRHTVRRALEELSRNGLVRVEQGRGTFVAEDVLDYTVEPRTRFAEWIRKHNKEPSGIVRQLREVPADRRGGGAVGGGARRPGGVLGRLGPARDRRGRPAPAP